MNMCSFTLYKYVYTCYTQLTEKVKQQEDREMLDKDLVKMLVKEHGWTIDRISGSHYILIKDSKTLSVPVHGKDVKPGLLNAILKSAGLK